MKIEELTHKIGTAYIDLDGVIAWLNKSVAAHNNVDVEAIDEAGWNSEYWMKVLDEVDIEDFFTKIELEPHATELIRWFQARNLPIAFLTRPVRNPHEAACIAGKKKWLKRVGLDSIPVIFEYDKEKYAISDDKVNILIDDHSGNIQKWDDAGGIGIHYRDFWFPEVKAKLEKLYGEDNED